MGISQICCIVKVQPQEQRFKDFCIEKANPNFKDQLIKLQGEVYIDHFIKGKWAESEQQTGQGIIFENETFYYQGDIVNGLPNGLGHILWKGGDRYDGEIKNGKAEGTGELRFSHPEMILSGKWEDGKPKLGKKMKLLINNQLSFIKAREIKEQTRESTLKEIVSVNAVIEYFNGRIYEGELKKFKNGEYKYDGKGRMTYPDNSYYQGTFKQDKMQGKGKYFWSSTGHWYDGQYKDNIRHGKGTYFFAPKDFKQGQWKDGRLLKQLSY